MDEQRIVAAIERSLLADYAEAASDVAFHMTDWLDDLQQLVKFYESPDALGDDQVVDLLMGILAHVPNHMNAAARLLTGDPVTDVFGIGATTAGCDGAG